MSASDERAQWVFSRGGALATALVFRADAPPPALSRGATLRHASLPYPLVAAAAVGTTPARLVVDDGDRLAVALEVRSRALLTEVSAPVALTRLAEFVDVAVELAREAGLTLARVTPSEEALDFVLGAGDVQGDALVLFAVALAIVADARGFGVERVSLVRGDHALPVDGTTMWTAA